MRIWLITPGEPLPIDSGAQRLFRHGILANYLLERGHTVARWASAFNHYEKRQRVHEDTRIEVSPGYAIWLLHAPEYVKNVSLARYRHLCRLAEKFASIATLEEKPDIILCSIPSVEIADEAASYAENAGIPLVLDCRDMWPDVILFKAPGVLRPLAKLALSPMSRKLKRACSMAKAITGHAPAFVDWGLSHAGRERTGFDRDFPFGYDPSEPKPAQRAEAESFWDEMGIRRSSNEFTVCYIGAISQHVRLDSALEAARGLNGKHPVRFVFCGVGDKLERYRDQSKNLENVHFTGWVASPHIWTLLRRSDLALFAMANNPNYITNIPNKVAEYLSAGLPIATTLGTGTLHDMLLEHDCGFCYTDDAKTLAERITQLCADDARKKRLSENAADLFESRFRADKVYVEMVEYLREIAEIGSPERELAYTR